MGSSIYNLFRLHVFAVCIGGLLLSSMRVVADGCLFALGSGLVLAWLFCVCCCLFSAWVDTHI
jgi:hypothetical protein